MFDRIANIDHKTHSICYFPAVDASAHRWLAGVSSLLVSVSVSVSACGGMTLVPVSGSGSTTLGGEGTSTGASTAASTSSSTGASSSVTSSGSGSGGSGSTADCGFLDCSDSDSDSDGGQAWPPCNAWAQDCPEGYKCTLTDSQEGYGWSTRCVMIDPFPQAPGDVCVATGPLTGVDNCEFGSVCWNVAQGTHEGPCVSFCGGSDYEPLCPSGYTCQSLTRGGPNAGLCLPDCDPIASDCPGDDLCIPSGKSWICVLDASGEQGAFGDPCEYANACDPGLYCLNPEYVPECQAAGCCTPFCDLGEPNTCPSALQVCIPWHEEGEAPSGYEHVGICGIPQ